MSLLANYGAHYISHKSKPYNKYTYILVYVSDIGARQKL